MKRWLLTVFAGLMIGACGAGSHHQEPTTPYRVQEPPGYERTIYTTPEVPEQLPALPASGSSTGERIFPMEENQRAPFPGVLFNSPSIARLEVQRNGFQQQCRLERITDLQRQGAHAIADIERMRSAYTTLQQQDQIIVESLGRDLQRQREQTNINYPWLVGIGVGGLLAGMGLFSTIYLLVH